MGDLLFEGREEPYLTHLSLYLAQCLLYREYSVNVELALQLCPVELSALIKIFMLSSKVATGCMWLLSTCKVAGVTQELNF